MQSGAGNITNLTSTLTSRVGGAQSLPAAQGEITLQDVADTINPLQHIPFVSTLYKQFTDSRPSTGSQLAGGALYGGPIGFVASLANVIFDGITGKPLDETIVAALNGDVSAEEVQVASNDAAETYQAAALDSVSAQEVLPPESFTRTGGNPAKSRQPFTLASAADGATGGDTRVLDLYGGSTSANRAYSRAQLRPYLQDVNQSMVL